MAYKIIEPEYISMRLLEIPSDQDRTLIPIRDRLKGKSVLRGACRICYGGCGVLFHIEDGRVVKIEGNPESTFNKGTLCAKGLATLHNLYNPRRLKYPMKRLGKRGEGKWQRISWDEALDSIANKLNEIKERYGAEAVAFSSGSRIYMAYVSRLANAFGAPNWFEPGSAQCFIPRVSASLFTYGDMIIPDYYTRDSYPKCVFIWGCNPVVTGPDGVCIPSVMEALRSGPKLIVADPRLSESAAKADIWLRIRPGTDDALALTIINVIIKENLYDKEFVKKWTIGFEKLINRVKEYTPEWAEKITWVPAEKIREAAYVYATTKPAAIHWGVASDQSPNSFQTARAIALLPTITGNVDVPGGNIFGMHIAPLWPPSLFEKLPEETRKKRLGADKHKLLCGSDVRARARRLASAHIPSILKAIDRGEIKAIINFGNNSLLSLANAKQVYDVFKRLDFHVVIDIYMTPTAELLADLVLPAATWPERDNIVTYPFVAENLVFTQKKICEMWEARQDERISIQLARKLGLTSNTEPLEDIINQQLAHLNIKFEEVQFREIAVPLKYRKYEESGFRTPSGKIELYSKDLEMMGYDPLPYYREPPESPVSTPELAKEYPLVLTTRNPVHFWWSDRSSPIMREIHPDPLMEIHPDTANKLGIKDRDWVWIETPRGRIKQKAVVHYGIDPRVVCAESHWWFPEKGGPDYGVWDSNVNILTNNAPPYDPAYGTYQLRAVLCKVYRC